MTFNLDKFRLNPNRENSRNKNLPYKRKGNGSKIKNGFVKGPIPLEWLSGAAKLPGKALHVGVALWYLYGLRKNHTVKLTTVTSAIFGLNKDMGQLH